MVRLRSMEHGHPIEGFIPLPTSHGQVFKSPRGCGDVFLTGLSHDQVPLPPGEGAYL